MKNTLSKYKYPLMIFCLGLLSILLPFLTVALVSGFLFFIAVSSALFIRNVKTFEGPEVMDAYDTSYTQHREDPFKTYVVKTFRIK